MFKIKLIDGTIFNATSVEENFRTEVTGDAHISLTIQNDKAEPSDNLEVYKNKLITENLKSISVYDETGKNLITVYQGYVFVRYLAARIQANGSILYDFNLTKEDLVTV